MLRIKRLAEGLLGLLVDDGRLAVAAVMWLVIVWLAIQLRIAPALQGTILFSGLALILGESAIRGSRRKP